MILKLVGAAGGVLRSKKHALQIACAFPYHSALVFMNIHDFTAVSFIETSEDDKRVKITKGLEKRAPNRSSKRSGILEQTQSLESL